MKLFVIKNCLSFVLLIISLSFAQPNPFAEKWFRRYDTSLTWKSQFADAVAIDSNGDVYVAGVGPDPINSGSPYDLVILKYNPQGNLLWVRNYDASIGSGGSSSPGVQIQIDSLDNIYAAGISNNNKFILLKYDPLGNILWDTQTSIPGSSGTRRSIYLALDDNNIYLTGSNKQIITAKYDQTGNLIWMKVKGTNHDRPSDIKIDQNGNIYVLGSMGSLLHQTIILIKYDSLGNQLWEYIYSSGSNNDNQSGKLLLSSTNHIYFTGVSGQNGKYTNLVTFKLDPDSTEIWKIVRAVDFSCFSVSQLAITNQESIITSSAETLIAYDTLGNAIWSNSLDDCIDGIIVDRVNNIYVLGHYFGIKQYNGLGTFLRRSKQFDPNFNFGDHIASEFQIDESGNLYAVGYTEIFDTGTQELDRKFLTFKYVFNLPLPNTPPSIISIPDTVAYKGVPYSSQILVEDPNNDAITYNLSSGPTWLQINQEGFLFGTPSDTGKYEIIISVSDGEIIFFLVEI